jgi:hypothetical protein
MTRKQRLNRELARKNPNYKKIKDLREGIQIVKNNPVGEGCKWSHCAYGCCGEGKCEKGCKECCDQPEAQPSYKRSQVVPVSHEMQRGGRRTRRRRRRKRKTKRKKRKTKKRRRKRKTKKRKRRRRTKRR